MKLLQGLEDKGLRRRLIVIFSTCIATTIASLAHAVLIIQGSGAKVLIAAFVEVLVCLFLLLLELTNPFACSKQYQS